MRIHIQCSQYLDHVLFTSLNTFTDYQVRLLFLWNYTQRQTNIALICNGQIFPQEVKAINPDSTNRIIENNGLTNVNKLYENLKAMAVIYRGACVGWLHHLHLLDFGVLVVSQTMSLLSQFSSTVSALLLG